MKVTQEKRPQSQVGLEIEIPADQSKQAYERTIAEFMRSIDLPGFRKGKIPRQILLQRVGTTRIKAAAVEDLLSKALKAALEQEKIQAIGNYQILSDIDQLIAQYEPGQPLTFSAAVDIPPDLQIDQYTGFIIEAEQVVYDPEQVTKTIEAQRNRLATLIPVEGRPAQMGDVVLVDFVGRLTPQTEGEDPQEIAGGKAENFELELAPERFVPGFIDGMVGMSAGESQEIPVEFPQDYPQEELAGKSAIFSTTLKEIKEKELPELNDEFAQEVSEFQTLDELKAALEDRYRKEAESKTKNNVQEAILQELLNHIDVELPESLISNETNEILMETAMQLANQGIDVKKLMTAEIVPQLRERSRPDAEQRLKRTLVLQKIAEEEAISVTADEINAKIKEFVAEYPNPQEIDPKRLREVIEADLMKEKILAWLQENNEIGYVPEGTFSDETDEEEVEFDELDPLPETEEI